MEKGGRAEGLIKGTKREFPSLFWIPNSQRFLEAADFILSYFVFKFSVWGPST